MLPGSFVMDDHRLISSDNPLVTGETTVWAIWFSGDFPLSSVGWWLERLMWGENPAGYHVVNLLLHATSVCLLWRLLVTLKIPGAGLAAALFAVHPVCVNSVARVAELKNTLSLPFFLLSFLAYVHYEQLALHPAETNSPNRQRRRATLWFAISLCAFVLSLLSKTTTIMLPLLLLCYAFWRRGRIVRTDLVHTSPCFLLSLGFGLLSMWYQKNQALVGETLPLSNLAERLAMAGWNFWFYLGKAIAPVHLSVVYFRWKPDVTALTGWLPDLLVLGIFSLCWCYRRSWGRHLLFTLGCFLIALFPALGLVDAQYLVKFQVSDHLQYLPLMVPLVPLVLMAALLARVAGGAVFRLAWAVLVLTLASYTFQRAQVYSTQESLMRDTLAKNPTSWGAHNDLGVILAERKNYPAAAAHFNASLAANADNENARLNLAQLLIAQGHYDEARHHLELGLAHNPANSQFHEHLADVLTQLGQPRAAIVQLQAALRLETKFHTTTRLALAGLLHATGKYTEAVEQYRAILATKPDLTEPLNNLAWILATCPDDSVRNGRKAVDYAEYACLVTKFKDAHIVGTLAAAYAEAGRFSEAVITGDFAVNLASANQDWQLAEIGRQLLSYYRAGKAWHEPAVFSPAFK